MSLPVTIENDSIRMDVWPMIGGKVSSIIDKADKFDLMFSYPSELPTSAQYDEPFEDSWHAGWDECFPAIAPSKYITHPYDGIAVPDHGELWGLPTVAVPNKDGITTVWHGLRFGYRLARKLYLQGPSIVAEYTLVNLAPFDFQFVWAQHALMSMTVPVELEFSPVQLHLVSPADAQLAVYTWPRVGDLDLSHVDQLPAQQSWKLFTTEPIQSKVVVKYPTRGRSLTIEYSSEDNIAAYWGLWINTGGRGRQKTFAIEPTTGRFDEIDKSVKDHSAGRVGPTAKIQWAVRWTLGASV